MRQLLAVLAFTFVAKAMAGLPARAAQLPAAASKESTRVLVNKFPEGEGKDIVLSACVQCHGLGEIISHRMDAKGWKKSILDMVARGTQLLPGESETLVQYLAANFSPLLDVNKVTAVELANLPSVDKSLAEAIVRYREKNGPFKEIQDVSKVEGVSQQILEKIKDKFAASSANDMGKKK